MAAFREARTTEAAAPEHFSWISTTLKGGYLLPVVCRKTVLLGYGNDRGRVGHVRRDAGLVRDSPVQISPHEIEPLPLNGEPSGVGP